MQMKYFVAVLFAGLFLITFPACKNKGRNNQDKSAELISISSLGLAYLEEFKLEEAEAEFKKFIKMAPDQKLGYANLGLTYLRMGRYGEAEKQLSRALEIDALDPDIRLILATVHQMNDNPQQAIAVLESSIADNPAHIKSIYQLTEILSTLHDEGSKKEREKYIRLLAEKAPANLVPKLNLADILIRQGRFEEAGIQLDAIRQQFPEFHREAAEYYEKTMENLKKRDQANLQNTFIIFHNYLKVTTPYQAGMIELKGPGGSLIGFPLITFNRQSGGTAAEFESILDVIRFTFVSGEAGLDLFSGTENHADIKTGLSHLAVADYDGDGDMDMYAGGWDTQAGQYRHVLLNQDFGKYTDATARAGIDHSGIEKSAVFADIDNDGFTDLFVVLESAVVLYKNNGNGGFQSVTSKSGISAADVSGPPLFADLDHEGDLDIFLPGTGQNLVFRNNSDGTFSEMAENMRLAGVNSLTNKVLFGDFDDDGDLDLVSAGEKGITLYSNQRQGIFRDMTSESGLGNAGGVSAIAAGDCDNDGYLDLFVAGMSPGNHALYLNRRESGFKKHPESDQLFSKMKHQVNDADFLDFDNDGALDLVMACEPVTAADRGIVLFHNNGSAGFTDVSHLVQEDVKPVREIEPFDYNADGDMDLALAGAGGICILRNDGGNIGNFIDIKLVGLRAGSAKNNYFGIGAKVELRAGDLYQTRVVTDPNVHFGIGSRDKADVVRITWTNGVPQNIFFPGTNQSLVEEQMLKGSCPFLYAWNGEEFVFVKDILWRSALGMPLGIMGGNTTYAFADASDDYLKIPGEMVREKKGEYILQVTAELWEAVYFDKLELLAVDHPAHTEVYVPEQFTPPPFPGLQLYQVDSHHLPVSATDAMGNDLLPQLGVHDFNFAGDFKPDLYQGVIEENALILNLGKADDRKGLFLFLTGWVFPTDASINVAISQSDQIQLQSPVIEVRNARNEWVAVLKPGFPMGKDKTVIADLTGKFPTADRHVRIRTNMAVYWDHVFYAEELPGHPVVTTPVKLVSADLHYRGFSRMYRKGGRNGPHWFDYSRVNPDGMWRDMTGNYTRYGNVLPLLSKADNMYVIKNAGDEITLRFDARGTPALKPGWKRDFLIRSVGWVKDADMNTATGNTVAPLPWHGMKHYPPQPGEAFPMNETWNRYNREYNTRVVTGREYLETFRSGK